MGGFFRKILIGRACSEDSIQDKISPPENIQHAGGRDHTYSMSDTLCTGCVSAYPNSQIVACSVHVWQLRSNTDHTYCHYATCPNYRKRPPCLVTQGDMTGVTTLYIADIMRTLPKQGKSSDIKYANAVCSIVDKFKIGDIMWKETRVDRINAYLISKDFILLARGSLNCQAPQDFYRVREKINTYFQKLCEIMDREFNIRFDMNCQVGKCNPGW
jgi:hypothetical protein